MGAFSISPAAIPKFFHNLDGSLPVLTKCILTLASAQRSLIANCWFPISKLNMPIPSSASNAAFRIIESANAVLPIPGLPAIIIKSPF